MKLSKAVAMAAVLMAGTFCSLLPTTAVAAEPPLFNIRVFVLGLASPAVLQNNGQDNLTVRNGNNFFSTRLATGQRFAVTVLTHPSFPAQRCRVLTASGIVNGADVSVAMLCENLPAPTLAAVANVHRATVSWNSPPTATGFDLYVSSIPNCDVRNYTSCPDGALFPDVSSPRTFTDLPSDQPRYFILETRYDNGARGLTQAGARPGSLVFNDGFVHAIEPTAQNKLLVGGAFTSVSVASGGAVPFDRETGQPINAAFPIVEGTVTAVESDLRNGFFIGGSFRTVGGVPRLNLAHILPDGSVDPDFDPAPNGAVSALAYVGNRLYIGGDFTAIGGIGRDRLAAMAGNEVVPSWRPVLADSIGRTAGTLPKIHAIAGGSERIFVAGDFVSANGQPRRSLVAFNAVHAIEQPGELSPWRGDQILSAGNLDVVRDLHVFNGRLYIGGGPQGIRPTITTLVGFKLDVFGNPVEQMNLAQVPTTEIGSVQAITVIINTMFLGSARSIHAVNAETGAYIRRIPTDDDVNALAVHGAVLYAGGQFTRVNGVPRRGLAALDSATADVLPWNPSVNRPVNALVTSDRTVYAGGFFTGINTVPRARLALLDTDGSLTSWSPSADDHVLSLAASPSGETIYAGGDFLTINGLPHERLAAIDANGVAIESFNHRSTSAPLSNRVRSILPLGNKIFVGGDFSQGAAAYLSADALTSPGVRLNFSPETGGGVNTVAFGSNQLYLAGDFTNGVVSGGTRFPRQRIAAYRLDGGFNVGVLDSQFNPPIDGSVQTSMVLNGILYLGGDFTHIDGVPHSRLGALDSTSLLQGWQPNANGLVNAMARLGNTILVAGRFGTVAGSNRQFLASINPNGTLNAGFDARPNAQVLEVAVTPNQMVYAVGAFDRIGGKYRPGFARLNADGTAD